MGQHTEIAWCDHTMNFWLGCTKVSPACDHCYAEALMDHRMGTVEWGNHPRKRTSVANWRQPYRWDRAAQAAGERRRVFTLSLGDFFDNQVDEAWRHDAWRVIADCRNLDWLILTKRPQNIPKMLPVMDSTQPGYLPWNEKWPWPHVWLGTTAENQEEWDRRTEQLGRVPAAVRFVSAEPLLGPIDVGNALDDAIPDNSPYGPIHWVIVGGESGAHARAFHLEHAIDLVDQCELWQTPCFVKQLGGKPWATHKPYPLQHPKGGDMAEWPEALRVREFPMALVA